MITHVVLIKVKGGEDFVKQEIKRQLETLPLQIPQIKHYEVGINIVQSARAYDVALYSKFESLEEMAIYAQHPTHQAVLTYIREHADSVVAADYES